MRKTSVDRTLLAVVGAMVTGGMLIFFSASLSLLPRGSELFGGALLSQIVLGLLGGLLGLWAMLQVPLALLKRFALHAFVASAVLTACVFLPYIGLSINGARRWIDLGFTTFQPSEVLKLGYILGLAYILSRSAKRGKDVKAGIIPFVALTLGVAVLLLLQPDTDTLIVIAGAGMAMMFAAGMRYRDIALFACGAVVLLGLLVLVRPYLLERVHTFLDTTRDPQGSGYQIKQSLIAIGSGEVWGRGFGQSIQKFNYLPEASSDSIFAVYAEEFGFVGSVLLIVGFLFLVLRGLWVAARSEDYYGSLVVTGIVALIGLQAFFNIAAMTGILPVGGLTLPFASHGGTSLLMTLVMLGIVLNVSRTARS